jgi:hypothetical protein
LFAKTLILKSHAFQLLLNFPLLFVQLVLPLLLLLQLLLQALLLSKRLLIAAALSQAGALQSSTRICLFGANRSGKKPRQSKRQPGFIVSYPLPFRHPSCNANQFISGCFARVTIYRQSSRSPSQVLRCIDATHKEFKRWCVEFLVLLSRAPAASLLHEIDAHKSGL